MSCDVGEETERLENGKVKIKCFTLTSTNTPISCKRELIRDFYSRFRDKHG